MNHPSNLYHFKSCQQLAATPGYGLLGFVTGSATGRVINSNVASALLLVAWLVGTEGVAQKHRPN